ncbi:hypothetical protein [Methylobacterium nigriterrae]|uniref:hypothetical protein n=1 Tax=Methylobacterium nigriterrae TaxID=3127512 RepID=UPI0030132813
MRSDSFGAKPLAAAFAFGGLVVMMIEPAPRWGAVAIGLACLAIFAGLSLLAGPARPAAARGPRRITVEIIEDGPAAPPRAGPAAPERLGPHPALLGAVRARRQLRQT